MDRLTPADLDAVYAAARPQTWPAMGIVAVVRKRFHSQVDYLGEVEDFSLYGVHDNGLNFVVALYHMPKKQALVTEIALLASFLDYHFEAAIADRINRNLHIGEAIIDGEDLFLAARIAPKGKFNSGAFSVMIDTWRHDLLVTLRAVHESHDRKPGAAKASPALPMPSRDFKRGAPPAEIVNALFARPCRPCGTRGRVGLLRRPCTACGGEGWIDRRGH